MCKNYFLSLFCALCLFAGIPATTIAQVTEVTLGRDADLADKIPVDYYNKNSHMQMIYTAGELQELAGKVIEAVTFYPRGSESKNMNSTLLEVYIGTTAKTAYSKTADGTYIPLEEMELCYSGVIEHNFAAEAPLKIVLDSPFLYPASGANLVIGVIDKQRNNWSSAVKFYAYETGGNRTIGYSNDTYSTFLSNYLSYSTAFLSLNVPKITFDAGEAPTAPDPRLLTPSLDFGLVRATSSTTQTIRIKNMGTDGLEITGFSGDNEVFAIGDYSLEPLVAGAVVEIPVIFTPAEAMNYQTTLTVNTNNGSVDCTLSGEAYAANTILIGDPASTTYTTCAPIATASPFGRTEILYRASEIEGARGKRITGFTFTMKEGTTSIDEPVKIYIVPTSEVYFLPSGRFSFTETESLSPYYEGELRSVNSRDVNVVLDRPFVVEQDKGIKITLVHNDGNIRGENFVYTETTDNTVYYATSSSEEVPANANATTVKLRPNVRIAFDELPAGPEISVPATVNFGTQRATVAATRNLKITNTGTEALQITGVQTEAPFVFDGASLLPVTLATGEETTVPVGFVSETAGEINGTATVVTDKAGSKTVALTGKSYPAEAYFQHFDDGLTVPKAWRKVKDPDNDRITSYSAKTSGGVNNSGYVETGMNYANSKLVSPKVRGDVSFYAKKSSNASMNTVVFKVYTSTDCENWTEIMDIGSRLTSSWVKYELPALAEDTYVGFCMGYGAVDEFFSWYAQLPQNDLVMGEITSLAANINEGAKTQIVFNCYNGGVRDIEAGTYRFEIRNAAGEDALVYTMPGNIDLPVADTAYVFTDSLIVNLTEKVKTGMQLYVASVYDPDEDASNNATPLKSVNITPYISDLFISEGATPERPKNLGIVESGRVRTVKVTVTNEGLAPLEITAIQAPEGYSVNKTSMSIPGKVGGVTCRDTLEVALGGDPGIYNGEITLTHTGNGYSSIYVTGEIAPAGYLLESFEGDEVPPVFWTRVSDSRKEESKRKGWEPERFHCYVNNTALIAGETSCMQQLQSETDTLITPLVRIKAGEELSFYAARRFQACSLEIIYSPDKINWTSVRKLAGNSIDVPEEDRMTSGTYEFDRYVCTLPEGEYYIGFAGESVMLDMVRGYEVIYANHDLAVTGFGGPETGTVNYANVYTVNYRNLGKQTESAYTITLRANDEEVASVQGDAIANLDVLSSELRWVPREAGTYRVYAEISVDGDERPWDNLSDTLTVTVGEEVADLIIHVGTPESANGTRDGILNTNYRHAGVKAIYTRNELGGLSDGAEITKVTIPYYLTNSYGGEFRVWIGNTEEESITSNSISVEGMTLLYEGRPFTEKVGTAEDPVFFELELNEPLKYTGGNLCLIMAADTVDFKTAIGLYKYATTATQSVRYQNDDPKGSLFVTAPEVFPSITSGYTQNSYVPVINLYTTKTVPVVSGRVVEEANGVQVPLTGAEVILTAGDAQYTAVTDIDGNFDVKVFQSGKEYQMLVMLKSYVTDTSSVDIGDADMSVGTIILKVEGGVGIEHTVAGNGISARIDRSGRLFVTSGEEIRMIRIFTAGGGFYRSENPMQSEAVMDMSGCAGGVYIVDVTTATGNRRIKVVR